MCRTPVRQLPYVSNVLVLSYWKLPLAAPLLEHFSFVCCVSYVRDSFLAKDEMYEEYVEWSGGVPKVSKEELLAGLLQIKMHMKIQCSW